MSSTDFSIRPGGTPERPVLQLVGELDVVGEPVLRAALEGYASAGSVHLDLTDLTFLDSSGIRGLMVGRRALAAAGTCITMSGASGEVRRVLDITGLGPMFGLQEYESPRRNTAS